MVERITPEMMTIAIAALAALTLLTFLMVLMTMSSLSRVKKRLLVIGKKALELEEQHEVVQQAGQKMSSHTAGLAEAADRIGSIERHLKGIDNVIAESQNQLIGHESRLNEHDALLGQDGRIRGKEATGFTQTIRQKYPLEEKFQDLSVFQHTFEQTRNRILDALDAMQAEMPPQSMRSPERKAFKEKTLFPSDEKRTAAEDFYQPRLYR